MQLREQIWLRLLDKIMREGKDHTKDDSPIREIIGVHEFIPNMFVDGAFFHALDRREMLHWVEKGVADIKDYPMKGEALADYAGSLDDQNMIDGGNFVYTYPERLSNYVTVYKFSEVIVGCDQLELMESRLLENIGSNRSVAVLYHPGWDGVEDDIPCLNWIQALVRDNKLILSVIFRSNDCYGAWPANMLFLTYVGLRLVDDLREIYPLLTFKGIDYHCSSLHIYKTDFPAVKKLLGYTEE